VSVDQVSFRYALQSQLALEGVSMKVNPGDFVAIVGPSGAGKSTIFRLLLGFEQPEQGSIFFDGRDLNDLDLGALRRQIGVVLQTSQLMPGDIFKNIVGTSQLTMEDAWAAAESAAIADDIRAMPMGMHTYVSEGAGTFSGGQIQRLLIARAIVKTPRILLFDEATSALDNRTQQLVTDSLASLRATRIVVAHRLSTVRSADRILVLDDGRVVESGSYHDLMAEQGLFAALALRQLV
jgi:ATP-binding cassette subfamily C protein